MISALSSFSQLFSGTFVAFKDFGFDFGPILLIFGIILIIWLILALLCVVFLILMVRNRKGMIAGIVTGFLFLLITMCWFLIGGTDGISILMYVLGFCLSLSNCVLGVYFLSKPKE